MWGRYLIEIVKKELNNHKRIYDDSSLTEEVTTWRELM
jgi:hypothetical protein